VYSRHLDYKRTAFQWGAWDSMQSFATAGGAVVGAILATMFGFKILFVIMGILALAAGLIILFLPRRLL